MEAQSENSAKAISTQKLQSLLTQDPRPDNHLCYFLEKGVYDPLRNRAFSWAHTFNFRLGMQKQADL